MIPGAPLDWLWNHRDQGFRAPDRKRAADEILQEAKWDVAWEVVTTDPNTGVKLSGRRVRCG
jgi:hypothetical protein